MTPAILLVLSSFAAPAAPTGASAQGCAARNNNDFDKLLECVDVDDAWVHLDALQAIADAEGGNRAVTLPGFDASVEYVAGVLEDAGYVVTEDPFEFLWDGPLADPWMEMLAPAPRTYDHGVDFLVAKYSGSGTVTANVSPVDLNLGGTSTSGCEPEDFADFVPGDIALIRRGTCIFQTKVENAEAAGASAVVILNQGNTASRMGLLKAILDDQASIPVVFVGYEDGVELAAGAELALSVSWETEVRESVNLFAQTQYGDASKVVMVGAHLDSVAGGPGINDNGTGVATLLELAENVAGLKPDNAIRFAFWAAEEQQVAGSIDWVLSAFDSGEIDQIGLYLNMDMIGSPNGVRFVYVDDGVPGTSAINELFHRWFEAEGLAVEEADPFGRTDTYYFQLAGVPTGGLYTGAEDIKTEEQAAIFGGTAGLALDPCYHQACDGVDNVNAKLWAEMMDAAAVAMLQWAMNSEAVNGVEGRSQFEFEDFETNLRR